MFHSNSLLILTFIYISYQYTLANKTSIICYIFYRTSIVVYWLAQILELNYFPTQLESSLSKTL